MSELTYTGLRRAIEKLDGETQVVSAVLAERARMLKEIGDDTAAVSEMIAEMGIDSTTVEECRSVAAECGALTEGVQGFLTSLQDVRTASEAMRADAKSEDGGIQDAVDASGISGVTDIDRNWFKNE